MKSIEKQVRWMNTSSISIYICTIWRSYCLFNQLLYCELVLINFSLLLLSKCECKSCRNYLNVHKLRIVWIMFHVNVNYELIYEYGNYFKFINILIKCILANPLKKLVLITQNVCTIVQSL